MIVSTRPTQSEVSQGRGNGNAARLTAAAAPWGPISGQNAPLSHGRRLRGVPTRHDRSAPAAPNPQLVLLRLVESLALYRLAGGRLRGDERAATIRCEAVRRAPLGQPGRLPGRRSRAVGIMCRTMPSASDTTVARASARDENTPRPGPAVFVEGDVLPLGVVEPLQDLG
jgi:hypothetical protein